LTYDVAVLNFDYFPLFRFLQMLHRLPTEIPVPGTLVDIVVLMDDQHEATAETKIRKGQALD
jgi:acyl CoA:acetate/3-ketoacid CoA transferase